MSSGTSAMKSPKNPTGSSINRSRQVSTSSETSTGEGGETKSYTSYERYAVQHGVRVRDVDPSALLWQSIRGKLFGRELQQQQLMDAFHRSMASDGQREGNDNNRQQELVLITGSSGTGKSALARSIYETAQNHHAYILYGKCDQIQKSKPLAPFVQAFTQFVHEVLSRGENDDDNELVDVVAIVRRAINKATEDADVDFLTDMIPAFTKLVGVGSTHQVSAGNSGVEQKPANKTRPQAEAPGVAIVCKLLNEVCWVGGFRIILFIDDLQWLDSQSIHMLRSIASVNNLQNFMLLGTCRGNEVTSDDELSVMLRELEEEGVLITEIPVGNLSLETSIQMLGELLQVNDHEEILPLASLAYQLTSGNPFFFVELIRSLFDERLLYLNNNGKWHWDDSEIRRSLALGDAEISDALVLGVIQSETDPIKEALQIASCFGAEFYVNHIHLAASSPQHKITRAVEVLVFKQMVMTTEEAGKFRWAHDRFQNSAFKLIPQEKRDQFRYEIGRKLLNQFSEEELADNAFLVSGLLYDGERFFQSESEREKVAVLFSIAGSKAAQSSAFPDAAAHFRRGIELLSSDHWQHESLYELSLQLYNCLAEMECCLGNTKQVDELCTQLLQHSRSLQDQMRAYDTQIYSLSSRNEMNEAIRVGLDVLRKLGEKVPRRVGMLRNIKELITTRRMLNRVTTVDVLGLRPLRKWDKAAVLQIVNLMFPAVLRSQPEYALILTAKCIQITLKYGLSPLSAVLFGMFSMILCNPVGCVDEGIRCEEIGFQIYEKFQANYLKSRMLVIRYAYCKPYTEPMRQCLPALLTGANAGMMTGDFELAFINAFLYCIDGLLCGLPLRPHYEKMTRLKQQYSNLGQETVMFYLKCAIQLSRNLLGMAEDVHILSGDEFDVKTSLETAIATNNAAGVSFILLPQLFLALFTSDYQQAVVVARRLQRSNGDNFTAFDNQYIPFLAALSEMIVARQTQNRRNLHAGNRALKKMEKWTKYAPENWLSRTYLIKAERDALLGFQEEATRKYFLSIEHASQQGLIHEQALALERVGLFLIESGQIDKALDCLYKARDLYHEWGCTIKAEMMTALISGRDHRM